MGSSSITGDETIGFFDNMSFDGTPRAGKMTTDGELWIGATASPHVRKGTLTSTGGTVIITPGAGTINLESGTMVATSYVENTGSATPAGGILNVLGVAETTTSGSGNTVSILSPRVAEFIVDPVVNVGTHQTITAAIAAASSGDTIVIRPGTYAENITLKAGVNLTGFGGDGLTNLAGPGTATANVTILGSVTASFNGNVCLSGIQLKTNGAAALITSGTNTCQLFLSNCSIFANDATGMTFNNANCFVTFYTCYFLTNSTNILFTNTVGPIDFEWCVFTLTATSSPSTTATSNVLFNACDMQGLSITTSSTGSITSIGCNWGYADTTLLTMAGTGNSTISNSTLSSTSASTISAGAGTTVNIYNSSVSSSNTNAITGAGTIVYSSVVFPSTSNIINTTTQTPVYTNLGKYKASGQPAFLAYLATTATDKTGAGAVYQLGTDALTEVFDQDNNFNTNGTFTAPVTGKYMLSYQITWLGATAPTNIQAILTTSNRISNNYWTTSAAATLTACSIGRSILIDMDANDTATVSISLIGDAGNTTDILGNAAADTFFSGYLVC